jgi:hypothetical protein
MPSLVVFGPRLPAGPQSIDDPGDAIRVEENPRDLAISLEQGKFVECQLRGLRESVWVSPAQVRYLRLIS